MTPDTEFSFRAPGVGFKDPDTTQFSGSIRTPSAKAVTKYEGARQSFKAWEQIGNYEGMLKATNEMKSVEQAARWRIVFGELKPLYTNPKTERYFAISGMSFDSKGANIEVVGHLMIPGDDGSFAVEKEVKFSWRGLSVFGTCKGDMATLAQTIAALDIAKTTNLPQSSEEHSLLWVGRCSGIHVDTSIDTKSVDNSVVDNYHHAGGF